MTITATDAEVYRSHADELTRYATVLVGPDHAADVVTDAVLAAFGSPAWRDVDDRRAYLFRCVHHQAASRHRSDERRRRREERGGLRLAATHAIPEPSIDALRALDELSPQQRSVVYLAYWEDRTAEQIAELLDVSPGTVRKQLARSRDRLREVLRP